jgi:hypothetical protein
MKGLDGRGDIMGIDRMKGDYPPEVHVHEKPLEIRNQLNFNEGISFQN